MPRDFPLSNEGQTEGSPDSSETESFDTSASFSDEEDKPYFRVIEGTIFDDIPPPEMPGPGTWLPEPFLEKVQIWPGERQSYVNIYTIPNHRRSTNILDFPGTIRRSVYEGLVPYKLERLNFALFPEWYFLLMYGLAQTTSELSEYVRYDPVHFADQYFFGDEEEIKARVKETLEVFSNSFKVHLGDLFNDIKDKLFTKEYVVDELIPALSKSMDLAPVESRRRELVRTAKQGNFEPLLTFLQAYSVHEDQIWAEFLDLCLPEGVSDRVRAQVMNRYEAAKVSGEYRSATVALEGRVDELEKKLVKDKILPIA